MLITCSGCNCYPLSYFLVKKVRGHALAVFLSGRFEVKTDSPPVIILCGYNDREDISLGMAQLYEKYKKTKN